ncbi:FkbM family methyltransferase [Roseivivax sp. CAU 1753]
MKDMSIAAVCHGVNVPHSPYLNDTRIARIEAARYEGDEIAGALAVVRAGDRVLEMGTGLGVVGAVAALNCAPERVLSFEANPHLLPHIEALYAASGIESRIAVRNRVVMAAPDAPETVTFHVHASFLGSSLIEPEARRSEPVAVATVSFDEVRDELQPSVILCDIEGGELDFLRHADLSGVRAVVMEFHPGAYGREGMRECKRILEEAGFVRNDDVSTRLVWTCERAA